MSNSTAPMPWLLQCHPSAPCRFIDRLAAAAVRTSSSQLRLHYAMVGDLSEIQIREQRISRRTDELWRHTCAELFVALPAHSGYLEFNFSPAGEWAAYEFDAYRQGMRHVQMQAPTITCAASADRLSLEVDVSLPDTFNQATQWQVGLSMVVENKDGLCSYWALTHPAERPDFHHRDSFVLSI